MSKSAKNLIVILGILTTVFAAYYFLTQDSALVLRSAESNEQLAKLQLEASAFAERQQILNQISIDTSILDSEVFKSLRAPSTDPVEFQIGRPDPFLPTGLNGGSRTTDSE